MSEILPASCCQYHLSWYCMFVQNATQTWCVPRATRTVLNDFDSLQQKKRDITHTHMLHVWNNYEHLPHKWPSFVGKYTIHGAYGMGYGHPSNPCNAGIETPMGWWPCPTTIEQPWPWHMWKSMELPCGKWITNKQLSYWYSVIVIY